MWPNSIVLNSPLFNQYFSFLQRKEYFPVQELISYLTVEALDVAILPGTAGFDKQRFGRQPVETGLKGSRITPHI
jgi:hypothetical protein